MGSCCGKKSDSKSELKKPSTPTHNAVNPKNLASNKSSGQTAAPNTGQNLFKSDDISTNEDTKKAIEDDKLEKEMKNTIKGGDSSYGKVKAERKENKKKGLAASNYNAGGLVDKQSKEYTAVRDFLAPKGYVLNDPIGSGNYAEVYKAWMTANNRFVAVKVIELTKANENYRVKFLKREIDIIRKLKHPAIIKHYEIAQTSNRIYMIMEYCLNGTVTDWFKEHGAMSEPIAWELDRRVLDGLNYMHSLSIAHRDLKLENILINDKFYPKISDFSYTVIVDENEIQSTTFCGSLPYFAPEILGRKVHNPLISDVWSLGVCFYIMVCDGLPFKIDDEKQMLNKQLERDWDFKKRVQNKLSNDFKQMIRRMLEPDVTKRANTQQLMSDPWIKNSPKPIDSV